MCVYAYTRAKGNERLFARLSARRPRREDESARVPHAAASRAFSPFATFGTDNRLAWEYTVRTYTTVLRWRERDTARASRARPRGVSATPPNPRLETCPASTAAGVAFCRRGRFEPTPVPDATPPAFARSRGRAWTTHPVARSRRWSGRAATCLRRGRRSRFRARKARASRRVFSTRRAMARGCWRPASRAGPPADAPSPRSRDARSARA